MFFKRAIGYTISKCFISSRFCKYQFLTPASCVSRGIFCLLYFKLSLIYFRIHKNIWNIFFLFFIVLQKFLVFIASWIFIPGKQSKFCSLKKNSCSVSNLFNRYFSLHIRIIFYLQCNAFPGRNSTGWSRNCDQIAGSRRSFFHIVLSRNKAVKKNLSFLICSSLCNLFILCVNAYASTVQILSCI